MGDKYQNVIQRDLFAELRSIGLTSDQCCEILDWTEKLPIRIIELNNIKVSIEQGVATVEPNKVMRSALITPDSYFGLQEWYMKVFECPKCKTKNPIGGTDFCRGCGVPVKMSKTVSDHDKTAW